MKQISTALASHLASEVTSLATCWKLTRRDGTIMGFTTHDRDIIYAGVTYLASSGFTPSAVANSASLNVDNMQVEAMIAADALSETDILAGKYDFAEIDVFILNYNDLSQGALKLKRGWLGEISIHNKQFVAEVRGLTQKLSQTIGELFSSSCRASLGDSRCGVNLSAHTVTGSISSLTSNQIFRDTSRSEASSLFNFGTLTFTSGANNGLRMEVKDYRYTSGSGGEITLVLPMPFTLQTGDSYSLTKGCDKSLETCQGRFANIVNYRGEPHIPGLDKMLETAATRSN